MISIITEFLPHIVGFVSVIAVFLGARLKFMRDGARKQEQKQKDKANETRKEMGDARDDYRRDGADERLRRGDF